MKLKILLSILIVTTAVAGCKKKEVAPPPVVVEPTGCCQAAPGSCASPITEAQCSAEFGSSATFHEEGTCRQPSGQCGVAQ